MDSLSSNIRHVDLTQPTIKAEVIDDVENTINKAKNLFDDLGGTDVSSSCAGSSKVRRALDPFSGLGNLAGDVIKTIGCASKCIAEILFLFCAAALLFHFGRVHRFHVLGMVIQIYEVLVTE